MREAGAIEWDGIKLGPAPQPPAPPVKPMGDEEAAREHQRYARERMRTALASSGFQPSDEWFDKMSERVPFPSRRQ